MYTLARKDFTSLDQEEVEVYFLGWKFSEDRNEFIPHWGYPHSDGCRDAIMYPNTDKIQHVLKRLPEEFKKGAYIVDLKVEPV